MAVKLGELKKLAQAFPNFQADDAQKHIHEYIRQLGLAYNL